MVETLSETHFWSDDESQLTIRTAMGPGAAIRLASFEADGRRASVQQVKKIEGHEHTKWRDYVYTVKR